MSLSSLIVQREVATIRQVEEALARQVLYGGDLVTNVLEVAEVQESVLVLLLAESLHIPPAPFGPLPAPSAAARAIVPGELAIRRALFPLILTGDTLFIAIAEPLEQYVKAELSFALGVQIEQRVAPLVRIREALSTTYDAPLDRRMRRLIARLGGTAAPDANSLPPAEPAEVVTAEVVTVEIARIPNDEVSPLSPYTTPALGVVGVAAIESAPARHGTNMGFPAPAPPIQEPPPADPVPEVADDARPTRPDPLQAGSPEPPAPPPAAKAPAAPEPHPDEPLSKSAPPPQVHPSSLVRLMDRSNAPPRSGRRRRGPLTFERAKIEVEQAGDRDTLLDLFFDFSLQFFEYTALFVVHGDIAEGRDAYGPGAPRERVLGVGVPLDMPSAFSAARDRSAPVIAHPGEDGLDAVLVQDLRRMSGWPVLVVPIVVRARTVALLYGDNGEAGVDGSGSSEVTSFASRVGQAFERIIVRRKLGGFVADKPTALPRVDLSRIASVASKGTPEPQPATDNASPVRPNTPVEVRALRTAVTAARKAPLLQDAAPSDPSPRRLGSDPADRITPMGGDSWEEPIPIVSKERGDLPLPPQVLAVRPISIHPIPREEPDSLTLDLTPGPVEVGSEWSPSIEARGLDAIDEAQLLRELEELDPANEGGAPDDEYMSTSEPPFRGPASNQAIAVPAHVPPSAHGRPESLPSVMVHVDGEFLALVDRLVKDATDEHAEAELLRQGQHAMPAIMARFPGPTTISPAEAANLGVRVSDCGPILRLVAGQRRVALPFVLAQVDDLDPDHRFWATFLLTELPYAEAVPAIAERLFDEHEPTRRVARLGAKAMAEGARELLITELDRIVRDPEASQTKRVAAMDTLAEMHDALVVPVLIGALGDDIEGVALAARRALMIVARQDFGRDTRRWLAWWSSNSSRHRIEWLIDSLTHDQAPMRAAAAEELKEVTKEFFGFYEDLPKRERERAQQRYRDWWRSEGRARFRRH